jgi:hypothetical protein
MKSKKIYSLTLLFFTLLCLSTIPSAVSITQINSHVLPLESRITQPTVLQERTGILNSYQHNSSTTIHNEYWAVLIGVSHYNSGYLPYSINEILSFKNTLLTRGAWNESHIMVLTDDAATNESIFSAISWLDDQETATDISVIYYVGHGGKTATNEYLKLQNSTISDDDLDKALDELEGRIVLIVDSCYSGGFIEECRDRNRVIMTACDKNELAYQYSELENGFFGYFLNLSLGHITKSAEGSFLLAYPLTVMYSNMISEKLGGDYTVHPQFYDGVFGSVKLIHQRSNIFDFVKERLSIFISSHTKNQVKIFKI